MKNEKLYRLWLKLTLLSDATFGRGDGLAGLVDAEVQHDEYGLPFLGGKTLKGLLCAECAEVLFALERCGCGRMEDWRQSARLLFGDPGSRAEDVATMRVGDARIPDGLRCAIKEEFLPVLQIHDKERREREWGLKRMANLESLTALRRQTAINPETGAPQRNALRAMRVIVRDTPFVARLDFGRSPDDRSRWLLAACVKAFHRAGTGRNRGRGRLRADLYERGIYEMVSDRPVPAPPVTPSWFEAFVKEVRYECADIPDSTR